MDDVLFYCWLTGAIFMILSLTILLQGPGTLLAMGISTFVAALITAIYEPAASTSQDGK